MSDPGHEERDVSAKAIFWTLLLAIVLVALVHAQVWFTYAHFRRVDESRDFRKSQLSASEEPPRPRLQITPEEDWEHQRGAQKKELNSYGWVSREQRIVRIPIRRAMELLVEREQSTPPTKESPQ